MKLDIPLQVHGAVPPSINAKDITIRAGSVYEGMLRNITICNNSNNKVHKAIKMYYQDSA